MDLGAKSLAQRSSACLLHKGCRLRLTCIKEKAVFDPFLRGETNKSPWFMAEQEGKHKGSQALSKAAFHSSQSGFCWFLMALLKALEMHSRENPALAEGSHLRLQHPAAETRG